MINYTLDTSRKYMIAQKLGEIIPFVIVEHAPKERALIIERKGELWMSIKSGSQIKLYPMKRVNEVGESV